MCISLYPLLQVYPLLVVNQFGSVSVHSRVITAETSTTLAGKKIDNTTPPPHIHKNLHKNLHVIYSENATTLILGLDLISGS